MEKSLLSVLQRHYSYLAGSSSASATKTKSAKKCYVPLSAVASMTDSDTQYCSFREKTDFNNSSLATAKKTGVAHYFDCKNKSGLRGGIDEISFGGGGG